MNGKTTALVRITTPRPAAPLALRRAALGRAIDDALPRVWMESLEARRMLSYTLPDGTVTAYLTPSADTPGAVDVRLEDPAAAPVATLTDNQVDIFGWGWTVVDQVPAALKPPGGIVVHGCMTLEVDAGPNDTAIVANGWMVSITDRSGPSPVTGVDRLDPVGGTGWYAYPFGPALKVVANDAGSATIDARDVVPGLSIDAGTGSHDAITVTDSYLSSLNIGGGSNVVVLTNAINAPITLGSGDDNSITIHNGNADITAGQGRRLSVSLDGGTGAQLRLGGDDARVAITANDLPHVTVNGANGCTIDVRGGSHAEVDVTGTGNTVTLHDAAYSNVELHDPSGLVTFDDGTGSVDGHGGGRAVIGNGASVMVDDYAGDNWQAVQIQRGVDATVNFGDTGDGAAQPMLIGCDAVDGPGLHLLGNIGTIDLTSGSVIANNNLGFPFTSAASYVLTADGVAPGGKGGAFGYYGYASFDFATRGDFGWQVESIAAGPQATIYASLACYDSTTDLVPGQLSLSRRPLLVRLNADGTPDASFGPWGSGVVTSALSGQVLVQPDGKVLVYDDHSVARFNPDGSPDAGYGDGGLASLPAYAFAQSGGIKTAFLGGDGALTLVGSDGSVTGYGNDPPMPPIDVVAMRLTPDGAPDESFGSGGLAVTPIQPLPGGSGSFDGWMDVFPQTGAQVLAAGALPGGGLAIYVAAWDGLLPDLMRITLDDQGQMISASAVPTPLLDGFAGPFQYAVTMDSDGSAYVTCGDVSLSGVVRLDPSGAVDTTFGSGGMAERALRGDADLVTLPDGRSLGIGREDYGGLNPLVLPDGSVLILTQPEGDANGWWSQASTLLRKILPGGSQPPAATLVNPEAGLLTGNNRPPDTGNGGDTSGGDSGNGSSNGNGGTVTDTSSTSDGTSTDPATASNDPWSTGVAGVGAADDSVFTASDPSATGLFAAATGSDMFNPDGDRQPFDDLAPAF